MTNVFYKFNWQLAWTIIIAHLDGDDASATVYIYMNIFFLLSFGYMSEWCSLLRVVIMGTNINASLVVCMCFTLQLNSLCSVGDSIRISS